MQTLTARYRVTTPLFMGAPEGTDRVELNLRGVKGAVRFWWRALNYARLTNDGKTLKALHEAEGRLFGAAAEKSEPVGASQLRWRVEWEGGKEPKTYTAGPNSRLPGAGAGAGTVYLGGQGLMHFRRYLQRPCQWDPNAAMLVVTVIAPDNWLQRHGDEWTRLQQTLYFFGLLGGIGSRKSRGFGSVSLEDIDVAGELIRGPRDSDEFATALGHLLDDVVQAAALPKFPAFSGRSRIWIIAQPTSTDYDIVNDQRKFSPVGNDPLALLNYVGKQMVRHRSYGGHPFDRETGRPDTSRPRKTVLGEDPEQNFAQDHDWAYERPSAVTHDRRIAFGLPIVYTGTKLSVLTPGGHNRRGSPLLIHMQRFADGTHAVVATMLPALLVPDGKLDVVLRRDRENPSSCELMANFEEDGAWNVLVKFVEGDSTVTTKPYFDRQRLIWPVPAPAATS